MAIIGINGYIGSGKDTVGGMIQYLTSGSLKSYEDYFKETKDGIHFSLSDSKLYPSRFEIKKFAGKLKQIAALMTGIPVEKFEDQEFKKTNLPYDWQYLVKKPGLRQDGLFGKGEMEIKQMTVREFLQKLGTDAIRDNLHDNAWVNSLMCDYKAESIGKYGDVLDYPNWIITDTRFPNEAKAIKDKGGIVIRINRPPNIDDILIWGDKPDRHISETALDDWNFDEVIENDNGLDKLLYLTEQVLVKHEII